MSKYTTGEIAKLREMKSGLNGRSFSLESISDIAIIMQGKKNLKNTSVRNVMRYLSQQ